MSKVKAKRKPAKKRTPRKPAAPKYESIVDPMDEALEIALARWDGKRSVERYGGHILQRESAIAYQAFCDYATYGPTRSLERLHGVYMRREGKVPTRRLASLKEWSASFDWGRRVRVFDEYAGRVQLRMYHAHLAQNVTTQLGMIEGAFEIVRAGMDSLMREYRETGVFPAPFRDVIRLFDLSIRHYRTTLGLTSENIALHITPKMDQDRIDNLDVTNEDLEAVLATMADALQLAQDEDGEEDHDYSQYQSD